MPWPRTRPRLYSVQAHRLAGERPLPPSGDNELLRCQHSHPASSVGQPVSDEGTAPGSLAGDGRLLQASRLLWPSTIYFHVSSSGFPLHSVASPTSGAPKTV